MTTAELSTALRTADELDSFRRALMLKLGADYDRVVEPFRVEIRGDGAGDAGAAVKRGVARALAETATVRAWVWLAAAVDVACEAATRLRMVATAREARDV